MCLLNGKLTHPFYAAVNKAQNKSIPNTHTHADNIVLRYQIEIISNESNTNNIFDEKANKRVREKTISILQIAITIDWYGTHINPILVGGGESAPCGFSDLYQKLFALAPWNLGTFPNHSLGVLCQNFDFLPYTEAAPGPFLWRYFSLNFEFSDIFHRSARCWGLQ